MIEISQRPIDDSEIKVLRDRIPIRWQRIENGAMAFVFALLVFLVPLLLIDKYWFDAPSKVELIVLIPVLAISAVLAYRLDRVNNSKNVKSDGEASIVTVYAVKTDRVIKRKDPEDFGPSYYFDLGKAGEYKTLFLFGQYLMEFKKRTFPSTEFKVIKARSGQVIDVVPSGEYLRPSKTLEAYSKEDFKSGRVPADGELLTVSVDEIMEGASVQTNTPPGN